MNWYITCEASEARALVSSDKLADTVGGTVVETAAILSLEADVLSPCALGAILTEQSIAALNTPVVAGGANNQLATPEDGARLHARGILYAPDYVINAGGIINVCTEYLADGDSNLVRTRIEGTSEPIAPGGGLSQA